jgi:hypothetical protein
MIIKLPEFPDTPRNRPERKKEIVFRYWKQLSMVLAILILCMTVGITITPLGDDLAKATGFSGFAAFSSSSDIPTATPYPSPPNQGIYVSCSLRGSGCQNDLHTLANVGLQIVINYSQWDDDTTINDWIAYAKAAQSVHMHIYWNFANSELWNGTNLTQRYPTMAASLGEYMHTTVGSGDMVRLAAQAVKDLPATAGYYIADEPDTANFQAIKMQIADVIHAVDPAHPRLIVEGSFGPTYNSELDTFSSIVEIIAQDYYPIGTSWSIDAVSSIASALQARKPTWGMVLQAHSLYEYPNIYRWCNPANCPFPSRDQMVQMRNEVLVKEPTLVLWYSYFDVQNSQFDPATHWANLVDAIEAGI